MWLNCQHIYTRNATSPKHNTEKKYEIQAHHSKITKNQW